MTTGALVAASAVAAVVSLLASRVAPRLWLAAIVVAASTALIAAMLVLTGGADWDWRSVVSIGGEPLHLRLDGISSLFLALLSVVGGAGAVYSREYWSQREHPRSAPAGRGLWTALMISLALVLLAANGLQFLVAWELFTLSSYFLITLERHQRDVRAAAWLYLVVSHVALLALFAFFSLLAVRTGTWELGPVRDNPQLAPLFWLMLLGFGLKAGAFPLHVWLPSAHANAPSHVSAIMSGVVIKMGIYGLVRFTGWMPVPIGAGWVVASLGVVSAVLGVAFALAQHDLKRLLAYHSVENIGIILIGLGFALVATEHGHPAWGALALAGGLLHVWNHGLFKALLFLGAGSVVHATRTRVMSQLGGLWRRMPWTTGLFALGAIAICGLPPLNGFVSEWLVYLGLFDATISRGPSAWAAIPAAILLGVTGALALACFTKVCGVVFLGAPRSRMAASAHECGPAMRGAMVALAALCAAIGLAPVLFWPAIARAVGTWNPSWKGTETTAPLAVLGNVNVALAVLAVSGVVLLLRRARQNGVVAALTWDCGYASPTARMQYTASSYAAIITEWFAFILRPHVKDRRPDVLFPVHASFEEHTPETVLDSLVNPAGHAVMKLSSKARRFQHGHVQSYLLYVLFGLAALTAVVLIGGA
jgi:hydrogenase-4 component B